MRVCCRGESAPDLIGGVLCGTHTIAHRISRGPARCRPRSPNFLARNSVGGFRDRMVIRRQRERRSCRESLTRKTRGRAKIRQPCRQICSLLFYYSILTSVRIREKNRKIPFTNKSFSNAMKVSAPICHSCCFCSVTIDVRLDREKDIEKAIEFC